MALSSSFAAISKIPTWRLTTSFSPTHPDVVKALSDALWKRQTSPEQHRYHFDARRTWDTLGNAPKVKVPTLILCGAGDDVNRGGSTPVGTARKLGELVPGCELTLVPNVKHMTFWDGDGALHALQDFLARHPIRVIERDKRSNVNIAPRFQRAQEW